MSSTDKPDKIRLQHGDWILEATGYKLRRVKHYGKPFTAIADVDTMGDDAFISGLLSKVRLSKKDFLSIKALMGNAGYSTFKFYRYNDQNESELIELETEDYETTV